MIMVYKVTFDEGRKAIIIVADGKGAARVKARKRYGVTNATITLLGPTRKR